MTLQERYDELLAIIGTVVHERKRSVLAPSLTRVDIAIVAGDLNGDVVTYEERILYVQQIEGVEVAKYFDRKPILLVGAEPPQDENPGPEADDSTLVAHVTAIASGDGQKVLTYHVQRVKTISYVHATVTDGTGFFNRTWLVSKGDGKTLEAAEQKVV